MLLPANVDAPVGDRRCGHADLAHRVHRQRLFGLLGAGGANDGFLAFYDVAKKKILREEKAATYVHDFVLSAAGDEVTAVGHNKVAVYKLV